MLIILIFFLFCPRFSLGTLNETFYTDVDRPSGWFHLVLNFLPTGNRPIRMYCNGVLCRSDELNQYERIFKPGTGRVVLGRQFIDYDGNYYADICVDELLFFNEALTDQNNQDLNN